MKTEVPIENLINIWKNTDSISAFLSELPDIGETTPYNISVLALFSSTETMTVFGDRTHFPYTYKIEEEKENSTLYHLSTIIG